MPAGVIVAIALLAPAASTVPAPASGPATPPPPAAAKSADDGCKNSAADADPRAIVICAQKPQGYRLDPDVMQAKRELRNRSRPTRPGPGGYRDTSGCVVGPAGCQSAGINLIGAALTAAEMAARLAKGQEVGSMFVTDPHPTEYQLYLEAKREREAKEAAKKAKAIAKAANAKGDAAVPQPEPAQP